MSEQQQQRMSLEQQQRFQEQQRARQQPFPPQVNLLMLKQVPKIRPILLICVNNTFTYRSTEQGCVKLPFPKLLGKKIKWGRGEGEGKIRRRKGRRVGKGTY